MGNEGQLLFFIYDFFVFVMGTKRMYFYLIWMISIFLVFFVEMQSDLLILLPFFAFNTLLVNSLFVYVQWLKLEFS